MILAVIPVQQAWIAACFCKNTKNGCQFQKNKSIYL